MFLGLRDIQQSPKTQRTLNFRAQFKLDKCEKINLMTQFLQIIERHRETYI